MNTMTMTVPARKEWILALRMAAASVGAIYHLPVDVLDDLRTAVDESCDLLLHQDYCIEKLTLSCEEKQDGVYLSIAAVPCCSRQEESRADKDVARMIIETLVRQVALTEEGGNVMQVRMVLPRAVK